MSEAGPSKPRKNKPKVAKDRMRSSKVKKISEGKEIELLEEAALQYVSAIAYADCLKAHR